MIRRAFLGGILGGAAAALLGGCGGGEGEPTPTPTPTPTRAPVRGIVLEDDGRGGARPVGRDVEVAAAYWQGDIRVTDTFLTRTDADGRFTQLLAPAREYHISTRAYGRRTLQQSDPFSHEARIQCASVAFLEVRRDGRLDRVGYAEGRYYTWQPPAWNDRARRLAAEYGVDVVLLTDMACVNT